MFFFLGKNNCLFLLLCCKIGLKNIIYILIKKYFAEMWAISWFFLVKHVVATSPLITSPRPAHHAEPLLHGSTIFVEPWLETAYSQGGSLIVKVDIKNDNCEKINDLIKIGIKNIKNFKNVTKINLLQIEKISFSTFRMEQSIEILINLANKLIVCENKIQNIIIMYKELKNELDIFWNIPELNRNHYFKTLSLSRPNKLVQTANFPTAIIGVGAGLLIGGVVGNLIGGKLDKWSLNNLNEKITKNEKNILITQESIEILEKNITDIFQDVKNILIELEKDKQQNEISEHMIFNLNNIADTCNNYINLFKIRQNRLTMMKNGIINSEIINIDQFKKVIYEGENSLKNLIFPIREISRKTIPNIAKIIEIKEVLTNKFIAIIPLVRKQRYEINTIIPLPIQLSKTNFMKIKIKNLMLKTREEEFIITDEINLKKIDQNTFIIKKIEPVWMNTSNKCEIAAYNRITDKVMDICNLEKLDSQNEIYISETKRKRIIFVINPEEITLDCPGGKIIRTLTGLFTIPFECHIKTKTFMWPARQLKEIKLDNLLEVNDKLLDIQKLKIFEINDTSIINKKIKDLIEELPNEDDKLTIDFDKFNWEKIEPLSFIQVGIIVTLLIINAIIIAFFCMKRKENNKGKKEWNEKWKRRWNENVETNKDKFNRTKDSIRNSFRNSFNRNKERLRIKGREFFREKVRDAGTNTEPANSIQNNNLYNKDVFVDVY